MRRTRRSDLPFEDGDCYQVVRSRNDNGDVFTVRHFLSTKPETPVCCETAVEITRATRDDWPGSQLDLEIELLATAQRAIDARHAEAR